MNQNTNTGMDQSDVSERDALEEIAEVLSIPESELAALEETAPQAPQGDSDTDEVSAPETSKGGCC